jgi:hypothetical protein
LLQVLHAANLHDEQRTSQLKSRHRSKRGRLGELCVSVVHCVGCETHHGANRGMTCRALWR